MKQKDLLLFAVCVVACACSTAPTADRYFEEGDFGAALAAYEATSSAHAIYQMAMIHLDQEWYNPQRAVELFEQLSVEFPESPYNRIGILWLSNWRERDRLAAELEKKLAIISTLQNEEDVLLDQLDDKRSAISDSAGRIRALNGQIEALTREVAELSGRLEIRERELEELMRIDLDTEPLDTSEGPSR